MSVLPIVDEFIVALGDCDEDDTTRAEILSIESDKIRIINTVWDKQKFTRGTIHAQQTDVAKSICKGDWLLYVQADEVIHEKDHLTIKSACQTFITDLKIDGFALDFIHFWGDYEHYVNGHGWYKSEVRIIRNDAEIHSWKSAQSFRRIPNFDGIDYRQTKGVTKLNVVKLKAQVFHYGYVRPPSIMISKKKSLDTTHQGPIRANSNRGNLTLEFDYGPMSLTKKFSFSHPAVMHDWILKLDWQKKLRFIGKLPKNRARFKHETIKYRALTYIETNVLGGRGLWARKNFNIIKEWKI